MENLRNRTDTKLVKKKKLFKTDFKTKLHVEKNI